ncbi:YbaB/EbfC family nucleoid-associated protein [Paractinoplanes brasiliensis]|uniref:DNA-binding protein YbaB n=1 Tax=Paractinoplanes brasiliensis TaxID=52695 RepID=A0A4R6JK25_9ACTN|nr:YbaB/EbfC family nucleoid-associated protein [Actinoplanes brasiliensis]TDO36560.1 DNA-binding protein YbaB [Actinoplanes brasiliensis]GID32473.1 hypothetical protein Abr02nite_74560 [Actinoplanes brasiliensis]
MARDPWEAFAHLVEEGESLTNRARAADEVSAEPGSDSTASVRVTLDGQGRVAGVTVAAGWRGRVGADGLPDAVLEAARDAATKRFTAWGDAYGDDSGDTTGSAGPDVLAERLDFQRRLQEAASGEMSPQDRQAALTELLALVQAIERGIDEVSEGLDDTLNATHRGQSPDRHVTVTVTGAGEVTAVRYDRSWLRDAHEINIGRQTTAAFRAAYEQVAERGVRKLIAGSGLGEAQRATQDPYGLARRLRLTD